MPPSLPRRPQTTLPAPVRVPALPDPSHPPAPLERRLPAHKGKVARIGDALTGLSEDLKAWVELRIELVQTEIMEQVEFRAAQAKMGAAAGLFAALGGFFLLVTLALLLGWLLFVVFDLSLLLAAFLGFLIVTLLLFLGALVAYRTLKPPPPPSARPDKSA